MLDPADVVPLEPLQQPPPPREYPGIGRAPRRLDVGRRRRWGWAPAPQGLAHLGAYLESCRQLHGLTQTAVARSAGMTTVEYRALIRRDTPPVTFDQLVSLCTSIGADEVQAGQRAWSMTREEALEVGLAPLESTTAVVKVSPPHSRPNASTRRVSVNRRR